MKKRFCSLLLILCLLMTSASALTVEQARGVLTDYYIDEIPEEVLAQPTIEEILEALGDPYTAYFDAEEYAAFLSSMEDTQLVGIGIRSYYLDEGVLLEQVAPDSPASEAGLQPGDTIIAIDGHDTRGAAEEDIDSWIRGDLGTSVRLMILRGEKTFSVTVFRRQVTFPTVVLEKIENRIGWISCSAFGSTTFRNFYDIITAHDDEVDEWVIDLRGNGGGDVLAAMFSAGCFAGRGAGAYLRAGDGTYISYLNNPDLIVELGYYDGDLSAFDGNGYLTMDPAHVLTDKNTASAAEFFCAAIRDSGAGLIIGARTYGKGVAQTLFSQDSHPEGMEGYFQDGDALKVTTERCYSTRGATYDQVGILPHFMVDADLADEAAALLFAPVSEGEDVLYLRNLSATSRVVNSVVMPMSMLRDPENAAAVSAILSALPDTAYCMLCENGELRNVTVEEAAQACGVPLNRRTFSDVEDSDFAVEINTLGVYGIVSGGGDGAFRPGETLDRASLCALLVKALRCPLSDNESDFADVPADSWYAPYVNALYEMGLIEGDDDGLFHPDDPVDHEQFLVILGRAAQWLDMDYYEMSRHDGIYGDVMPDAETLEEAYGEYSSWARELIWLCGNHLAWADLEDVDPKAATTREEAAKSVYNLFHMSGALPG
ncbi:MAG: S41 family peptidase [Oscillospiraceae bacterium]